MNRTILHVIVVLQSFLLHNRSVAAASWQSEYWIAYRGSGEAWNIGDGSLANPYNGNGADNFDVAMNNIQQIHSVPSIIHILPGTYSTHGDHYTGFGGYGWQLQSGWRIKGSGIDNTVIQLMDAVSDNSNSSGFNTVISSPYYGGAHVTNCSVSDLTIDCNYSGVASLTGLTNLGLAGIRFGGDHLTVERVKVINAAGKRYGPPYNAEEMIISVGGPPGPSNTPATGLLIRDCEVSSYAGGYCSAIALNGLGGNTGASGIIENNRVILSYPNVGGPQFAYNIGGTPNGVIVVNNIASGAGRSLNFDSGYGTNFIVRGNMFLDINGGAVGIWLSVGTRGAIENNIFELTGDNSSGLLMTGGAVWTGVTNCVVRNNSFINKSGGANNYAISFWSTDGLTANDWPKHSSIENNRIDSSLKYIWTTSSSGFWFNNTDFDGNNLSGLSSIQTSRNVVANKP